MKTVLLFVTLAFSLHVFAQNNPVRPFAQDTKSKIMYCTPAGSHPTGLENKALPPEKNFVKDLTRQTRDLLTEIFIYDSIYLWQWDTFSTKWVLTTKAINFAYNAAGLATAYTYQTLQTGTWTNLSQYLFTYDSNNNELSFTYKGWNGTSFQNLFRNQYTYDANNNRTSDVFQIWSGTAWVNYTKTIYTYDGSNNRTSQLVQDWNGTSFENNGLYTYTYDANRNLLTEIDQTWNDVDLVWENVSRYLYTYDGNNNQLSYKYQNWNINIVDWEDYGLYTNTYDANNNLTNQLFQYWDGTQWINYLNTINTYNASNDLTNSLSQTWNLTNWENLSRITNTYNGNHQVLRSLAEGWDGTWRYTSLSFNTYGENNFLESNSDRSFDLDGVVVTEGDSTFNFFHTITGTDDLAKDDFNISVSPNPTTGKFTINSKDAFEHVVVYTLLGERILSIDDASGKTSAEINLADYGKGIYLVQVSDGKKISNRKVLVQ